MKPSSSSKRGILFKCQHGVPPSPPPPPRRWETAAELWPRPFSPSRHPVVRSVCAWRGIRRTFAPTGFMPHCLWAVGFIHLTWTCVNYFNFMFIISMYHVSNKEKNLVNSVCMSCPELSPGALTSLGWRDTGAGSQWPISSGGGRKRHMGRFQKAVVPSCLPATSLCHFYSNNRCSPRLFGMFRTEHRAGGLQARSTEITRFSCQALKTNADGSVCKTRVFPPPYQCLLTCF